MDKVNEILDFWFEGISDGTLIDKEKPPVKKWFEKNPAFDNEIRNRFEGDLVQARQGKYKEWEKTAAGRLALIILCDQFSRNMYRDTKGMFESDPLALGLTVRSIKDGTAQELQLIERVFLCMPLMHAEDLKMQQLCVRCFEEIVEESQKKSPQNTGYFKYNLSYAQKHRDIIARFGRFPHRNRILKRTSTPEELGFLKKPGSSF